MDRYTGFKSSPQTEGALFYGEKLVDVRAKSAIEAQAARLEEPRKVECPPGASG
jgi:hypothetical protein